MIELKSVTKRFGDFAALDDVSIRVPRGAVFGLIGPNGAGKTTAIRCITGMLKPEAGQVHIGGEPVWDEPGVKSRFFCIPDEPWCFAGASTRDMMEFYRRIYPGFDEKRYEALWNVFSLNEAQPIRRLSRGRKKQSAFWLALSARPEVLILDEPVDGLDPLMRRQVWKLILSEVADREMTVLISSHNLRELEDVCDHVAILQKGKVLLQSPVAELQENTSKFVLALPEGATLPQGLDILSQSRTGKLITLILRGREEELRARLREAEPQFLDAQPLTLEEIFIYELGGEDHGVQDILL
ncbi:MAG: ABC transporter ATP-binding protein [Oscillospiraceae bacterium]|nr:ABC transporter ATP-binding protein [Oscillospiraceae bacterium]MBR6207879.1 ABC transporter ATP-binding protein [Oscillospiraceae bacterium]